MKKICAFLKNLLGKAKKYADKYVKPSIAVVEGIKAALDSPAIPFLTTIIPGNIDDIVVRALRAALPTVLKVLGYVDECRGATGDALLQCAIAKIRLMTEEGRDAAFHNIAALLAQYISDGKLTWRECIHLAEEVYNESKK